ncbi:MAG: large conductance mechanosensitive channel protein MscL [Alphaproteobacteria bacterium]|nr:large conductance mechanosensitive channel protein MscL [Alphaproteobacteria bacterium]
MFFGKFAHDFGEFIRKGSAIDMAVGIITGAALTSLVNSFVKDIFTPPIGLLIGGLDFSDLHIPLGRTARMNVGVFINVLISFAITMFAIFLIVKVANRIRGHGQQAPATRECPDCKMSMSPAATRCPYCTSHVTPLEKA